MENLKRKWRKTSLERENGKCKGPGVGMSQVCLRIGKEASGARAESARRGWQEVGTRAMGLDRMLLGSWLSPRMRWGYHWALDREGLRYDLHSSGFIQPC